MAEVTVTQPEPLDVQVELPRAPRVWFATDLGPKGEPGGLQPALLASRPATAVPGQMFTATDTGDTYVWTGATWLAVAKAKPSELLSTKVDVSFTASVDTTHQTVIPAATIGSNVPVDGRIWKIEGTAYGDAAQIDGDVEVATWCSTDGGASVAGYPITAKAVGTLGGLAALWQAPALVIDTAPMSGSLCPILVVRYTGASTNPVSVSLTATVTMTRL